MSLGKEVERQLLAFTDRELRDVVEILVAGYSRRLRHPDLSTPDERDQAERALREIASVAETYSAQRKALR